MISSLTRSTEHTSPFNAKRDHFNGHRRDISVSGRMWLGEARSMQVFVMTPEPPHAEATTTPARSDLPRAPALLAQKSDAARCDVAVHVITSAQEDDSVTGRIGLVIFQLVVRDDDLCSDIDVFAT